MPTSGMLHFEVSASLQKLIGEELISNDEMAVIELLKNSYDSGASTVDLEIHQETLASTAYISIYDNGEGMDLEEFTGRFMFAGYSERDTEANSATRIPTGEKGIGRFAADKLGSELIVVTKKADSKLALQVSFNWNEFRHKSKKFNEVKAPYTYISPPESITSSGTAMRINYLRSKWDSGKLASLRDALRTLLNPYSGENATFRINLHVFGPRPSTETITSEKPTQYDYELQFKVLPNGQVVRKFRTPSAPLWKEWKPVAGLSSKDLPELRGRLLYYVKKPSRAQAKGLTSGVQLFRDGFLMQPFGSPISDRLQLIEKRAKRAGHAPLVPNRLFGFVEISRLTHPALKDTTSRQAMLETKELFELVRVLKSQTDFLEENLLEQVHIPSWQKSASAKSILIEQARLNSLGNLSVGIGHEIRQPLQTIFSFADAIELRLRDINVNDPDHYCPAIF